MYMKFGMWIIFSSFFFLIIMLAQFIPWPKSKKPAYHVIVHTSMLRFHLAIGKKKVSGKRSEKNCRPDGSHQFDGMITDQVRVVYIVWLDAKKNY